MIFREGSGIRCVLFENDYAEFWITYRIREQLDPDLTFATDIIMNSDLGDVTYLYRYGEYVGKMRSTRRFS